MGTPQHILFIAVEPKTKADREKLAQALQQFVAEDPTFGVESDVQAGQSILLGMSESQLEIIVDRLKCEFNLNVTASNPQVVFKETVTQSADGDGHYVRQTGDRSHYAHARIRVAPGNAGSGYVFDSQSIGDLIPKEYIASIDDGIRAALTQGILSGYPIDDIRVELYSGSFHEADSSATAFEIAGAEAFRDAAKKAIPVLLEPVMAVEVVSPEEYMGPVVGDLISRRAHVESIEDRRSFEAIKSSVPLPEMLGYARDLSLRTKGLATFSMSFDRYQQVPGGPPRDDQGPFAPVVVPRTPRPRSKISAVAIPKPECE